MRRLWLWARSVVWLAILALVGAIAGIVLAVVGAPLSVVLAVVGASIVLAVVSLQ